MRTLPNPPNPRDLIYRESDKWRDAMYEWAQVLRGKLEADSRQAQVPAGRFDAVVTTTNTSAVARNVYVTLVNPTPVIVTGVSTGTATITAVQTGTRTGTITDVASADALATLVNLMIKRGIVSPNAT